MSNQNPLTRFVRIALALIENLGLFVIGIATIMAGYQEVMLMIKNQAVTLGDLLLLFLYLEVLTMVSFITARGNCRFDFLYI